MEVSFLLSRSLKTPWRAQKFNRAPGRASRARALGTAPRGAPPLKRATSRARRLSVAPPLERTSSRARPHLERAASRARRLSSARPLSLSPQHEGLRLSQRSQEAARPLPRLITAFVCICRSIACRSRGQSHHLENVRAISARTWRGRSTRRHMQPSCRYCSSPIIFVNPNLKTHRSH